MTFNKHYHRHSHCAGGYSPTYRTWSSLKSRCTNPKRKSFALYQHRWYPPWADFGVFLADMGERPPGAVIDRIDNTMPYGPGNCRWTTVKVNNRNSSAAKLTARKAANIRKSTLGIDALAKKYGVLRQAIWRVRKGLTWAP